MKKTVKFFALVMALVLCTLVLVSCSSFGSIKSNFEKNGYALSEDAKTGSVAIDGKELSYTIHTFKKENDGGLLGGITSALSTAIVWEFASSADLNEAIENSEDIKAVLKDAEKSRYVNGNCILMTINPDAVKLFNGESLEK